ncbi:hypothetical protein [Antrihabitans cavernicola]|uniref:Peptidase S29 domain-containing protein n=1 Tax=Antrihabitans cavernicola TaxID=2495913 RepID=A0A5A7SF72_9NOCA|nr:hypothetical protein [Spelaeibacter cavernicola]KAA0024770.1 hypothetical protein FOY51_02210 [Spelaeibacter cavernicola]
MSSELHQTPTRASAYGPETFLAAICSLVLQGLATMDLVPIGLGAFILPLVVGLVLVAIAGRSRRIGAGLLVSLITLPFAVIGVLISGGLFTLIHGN